jgi:hypothetical protein
MDRKLDPQPRKCMNSFKNNYISSWRNFIRHFRRLKEFITIFYFWENLTEIDVEPLKYSPCIRYMLLPCLLPFLVSLHDIFHNWDNIYVNKIKYLRMYVHTDYILIIMFMFYLAVVIFLVTNLINFYVFEFKLWSSLEIHHKLVLKHYVAT